MRRMITVVVYLSLALMLFPSMASAHWGDGDGHFTTALMEWGIILGSLGATAYLVFFKKPVKNNNPAPQNEEELTPEV